MITRDEAYELLKKYNKEDFHLHHGRMVEGTMRYFAKKLGYADEEEFWGIVGLLHDIDFEMWPDEHCKKAPELLREAGVDEDMIHAIVSHGYGLCVDVEPEKEMEKVLFACDELTGLIGAAALMRPSKSVQDMELKSLKKKFKDKHFAAGCDREVIKQGAEMLGWELDELLGETLEAMKTCERIAEENGVSKATVLRASKYMKGVEIAESLIPGMREKILNKQVKVSKADMHRLARANYDARAQTLQEILHPELKVEPKPDADGIIREPGKAPVLPFQKIESVYDSDAYPEEVRHDYVALEHVTTRFRTEFDYLLRTMPDTAQREVILEIIHKHKEYLASLESALAEDEQTA